VDYPFKVLFGRPDGQSGTELDRSVNQLMVVSFLLLIFGGLLVPPDGSPVWISAVWVLLALTLLGWFFLAAYRVARAFRDRSRR
jgi:hypothetical protein